MPFSRGLDVYSLTFLSNLCSIFKKIIQSGAVANIDIRDPNWKTVTGQLDKLCLDLKKASSGHFDSNIKEFYDSHKKLLGLTKCG